MFVLVLVTLTYFKGHRSFLKVKMLPSPESCHLIKLNLIADTGAQIYVCLCTKRKENGTKRRRRKKEENDHADGPHEEHKSE